MTELVNATELARLTGKSKGAVSQWVSSGKLEGCYAGEGRMRRFDVAKCAIALDRKIDRGQRLGNAAGTQTALERLNEQPPETAGRPAETHDGSIEPRDQDRYALVRTQRAEEELRKARRDNARDEGMFVHRETMDRTIAKMMAVEIAGTDAMLNAAARKVANELDVEFVKVRTILREGWRNHRRARAADLKAVSDAAHLTEIEKEADI